MIRAEQYLKIKELSRLFMKDVAENNDLNQFVEEQIKENNNLFKETVMRAITEGVNEALKDIEKEKLRPAGTEHSE